MGQGLFIGAHHVGVDHGGEGRPCQVFLEQANHAGLFLLVRRSLPVARSAGLSGLLQGLGRQLGLIQAIEPGGQGQVRLLDLSQGRLAHPLKDRPVVFVFRGRLLGVGVPLAALVQEVDFLDSVSGRGPRCSLHP